MLNSGLSNWASLKFVAYGTCVLVALAAAAALIFWKGPERTVSAPSVRPVAERRPSPFLHCLFSDFTHASVVVGFDFAVSFPSGGSPRFAERAEAVREDPAVNFDADNRPAWSYILNEDGIPEITSPDGATRILLYGLKLGTGDVFWIDAGIRSNTFRNLDGKCLQAHFDKADGKGATKSAPP